MSINNRLIEAGISSPIVSLPTEESLVPVISSNLGLSGPNLPAVALLEAEAQKNKELLNQMSLAISQGDSGLLQKILEPLPKDVRKALVNTPQNEQPLLLQCAEKGNEACMKILLEAGADLLCTRPNQRNFLHIVAFKGRSEMMQIFLREAADRMPQPALEDFLNSGDKRGLTPLIRSAFFGKKKCVSLLLHAKADPLIFSKSGCFPYTEALWKGHSSITQLLLAKEPKLEGAQARNLLEHVFDIELNPKLAGHEVPHTGCLAPFMHKQILATLRTPLMRNLFSHCKQEQYEELLEAFAIAGSNSLPMDKIVSKIRAGKLVIIPTGWEEHCIDLVFREGYLVICNTGEGCRDEEDERRTFFARKISKKEMTKDLLEEILKKPKSPFEKSVEFFYKNLPEMLCGSEDNFCQMIATIAPEPVETGICTYAAGKGALRVSMLFFTKDPQFSLEATVAWSIGHQEEVLEYFKKTPSIFDEPFCRETHSTLLKRLNEQKDTLLMKLLFRLKEKINKQQSIESTLDDIENLCGKKKLKKLEECLDAIGNKKKGSAFAAAIKNKFLDPKINQLSKQRAIDLYMSKIDPSGVIRAKLAKIS